MSKTKKLDIFNLFYSGAAVVILRGVIAKLLEWPAQDLLITGGLAIEAVVFGVSAIKFVEIKKESEVATEATLSKMADGLGNLSAGVSVAGSGNLVAGSRNSIPRITKGVEYLENDTNAPNYTESSWNLLEQMDVLTLTKDMFYHPSWVNLKSDEYAQITKLFKTLFDKKLPSKDALPFLIKFPVAFPKSDIDALQLNSSHVISLSEIELLWKALKIADANYLFEKAILEESSKGIVIRFKKENEIQIYGGESAEVVAHAKKFHPTQLIISPTQYYLQDSIQLKEEVLIGYLIENANTKNQDEVVSISNLISQKSDEVKKLLWNKLDTITYDAKSGLGYMVLKALVASTASFNNKVEGSSLLLNKIAIQTENNGSIDRNDVINYTSDTVYFGKDNEYSVKLAELFSNGELKNKDYFDLLINKLVEDKVATKETLNQLFKLATEDTVADVLKSLNHHLAKTNSSATGAQLSFVLLCKVFINS